MFRGSGAKFKRKSNLNILTEKLLDETTERDEARGKTIVKQAKVMPRTEVKLEAKVVEKDKPLKFINFKSLLTS